MGAMGAMGASATIGSLCRAAERPGGSPSHPLGVLRLPTHHADVTGR